MKKFNLFPVFLLIIGFLTQSCVYNPKQTASTMIILKDVDCQNCYEEISKIINSKKGIINYTIAPSINGGKENSIILILIEYKQKGKDVEKIKMDLISRGYIIDSSE